MALAKLSEAGSIISDNSSYKTDFLVLFIFAAAVSFIYFTGFICSDDIGYLGAAKSIAGISNQPVSGRYLRVAMIIPYSLYLWILRGFPLELSITYFTLIFILLCLTVYYVGRKWIGRTYGIIASILVTSCPTLYCFSGAILPDITIALIMLLAIFFTAQNLNIPDEKLIALKWNQLIHLTVAGFCIAMVYTVKEPLILTFFPLVVYILIRTWKQSPITKIRIYSFFISGILFGVFLDSILSVIYCGSPFVRTTAHGSDEIIESLKVFMTRQGTTPGERFNYAINIISKDWKWFSFYVIITLGGFVFHLFQKGKKNQLFLICFFTALCFFIIHVFASVRLTEYVALPIQVRYFGPMMPLLIFSVLFVLKHLCSSTTIKYGNKRQIRMLIIGFAVVIAIFQLSENIVNAGRIYRSAQYQNFTRTLGKVLDRYPNRKIVADDYYSFRVLNYGQHNYVVRGTDFEALNGLLEHGFIYITINSPNKADPLLEHIQKTIGADYSITDISNKIDARPWRTSIDSFLNAIGRRDLAKKGNFISFIYDIHRKE